jgi:molecular chaperone HtpG
MSKNKETLKFEAETKQLLELMIHSLYSKKEIFLRELISNASDAGDKLRFEGLTKPELRKESGEFEIRIETDKVGRTLTISDNGIGMSRQELMTNIGTIAKSGTKELLAKLKENGAKNVPTEFIGEFGVGFYSCFMVAKKIVLVTRRAGEEGATTWESRGDGSYSIGDAKRDGPGTTITLHLKNVDEEDGLEDFTEDHVLRRIVKKYSDFVRYPVILKVRKETEEDGEKRVSFEDETLNSMKAIWLRPQSEVTDEDLNEFYRHISRDWTEPYAHLTMKAEGRFEYQALLYLPGHAPFDLYSRTQERGLQLYVKNVKILDSCEELLPEYLRFIKGVVDSPDLPLNVSREMLQNSRQIAQIRKALSKKVLDTLKQKKKKEQDDADGYLGFYKEFGGVLKEGISIDFENKDKIVDLLLFESSNDPEKMTSLKDYVSRMKEEQKEIYYIAGESRQVVESSPHLEAFTTKGYEVLYMTDPVDEFMLPALVEYDGKALKSVSKGEVELGTDDEKKEAQKELEEKKKQYGKFLEALQKELDDFVQEVRLSKRLTSSAVCLVGGEQDLSPHIERLLEKNKVEVPKHKRIMEINPDHEIVQKLKARYDLRPMDLEFADHAQLLLGQALLAEGSPLPDPAKFAGLVSKIMTENL